ncbi:calmodulin-like 3 [Irineochytrium annulatum]|nr:calmodulin-like 3 [Irineochytrium annulatum]
MDRYSSSPGGSHRRSVAGSRSGSGGGGGGGAPRNIRDSTSNSAGSRNTGSGGRSRGKAGAATTGTRGKGGTGADKAGGSAGGGKKATTTTEEDDDAAVKKKSLSAEQREYYQEAFNLFDKDENGGIDIYELGEVMRSCGMDPSEEELQAMIGRVDVDHTGTIEFEEFLTMIDDFTFNSLRTESQITEAFKAMDADHNGFISAADLLAVLQSLDEVISGEEALEMIKHGDMDGDGQVGFEDFAKVKHLFPGNQECSQPFQMQLIKIWDA